MLILRMSSMLLLWASLSKQLLKVIMSPLKILLQMRNWERQMILTQYYTKIMWLKNSLKNIIRVVQEVLALLTRILIFHQAGPTHFSQTVAKVKYNWKNFKGLKMMKKKCIHWTLTLMLMLLTSLSTQVITTKNHQVHSSTPVAK